MKGCKDTFRLTSWLSRADGWLEAAVTTKLTSRKTRSNLWWINKWTGMNSWRYSSIVTVRSACLSSIAPLWRWHYIFLKKCWVNYFMSFLRWKNLTLIAQITDKRLKRIKHSSHSADTTKLPIWVIRWPNTIRKPQTTKLESIDISILNHIFLTFCSSTPA